MSSHGSRHPRRRAPPDAPSHSKTSPVGRLTLAAKALVWVFALQAPGYRPRPPGRHGLEVIPTLRRDRDDVFVIGEESLLLDGHDTGRGPDPKIAIEGSGGRSCRRSRRPHRLPAALPGPRGLALIALALGAAALAALRPGGGGGPDRPADVVSQRSPLISRSAAGAPAAPRPRARHPARRAAEVPPRSVHHQRSRRAEAPASPGPEVTRGESVREPTSPVAPVSSPVLTPPSETAPSAGSGPAATATSPPPSPPPSSSGGGPGGVGEPAPASADAHPAGVEAFGFER